MATGLMTVAYLGEIAVVFNLAYLELHRDRYVNDEKTEFFSLQSKLKAMKGTQASNRALIKKLDDLDDRLRKAISNDTKSRQLSWYETLGDVVKHKDWLSRVAFKIFADGDDRRSSELALFLSVGLLFVMTICDKLGLSESSLAGWISLAVVAFLFAMVTWAMRASWKFGRLPAWIGFGGFAAFVCVAAATPLANYLDSNYTVAPVWWLFFLVAAFVNFVPVAFVFLGRRVTSALRLVRTEVAAEFQTSLEQHVLNELPNRRSTDPPPR